MPPRVVLYVVINISVLAIVFATDAGAGWSALILLWSNLFLYCMARIHERAFLAGFLIAFLVLLMSRDILIRVFGAQPPATGGTSPAAERHLVVALLLSLSIVWISHLLWTSVSRRRHRIRAGDMPAAMVVHSPSLPKVLIAQSTSLVVFYVSAPVAALKGYLAIGQSSTAGYAGLYLGSQNPALILIADACFVSLALFLATMPKLSRARWPIFLWTAISSLELLAGQRGEFVVTILLLLCYAVIRSRLTPDEGWMKRSHVVSLVVIAPALLFVLTAVETWRGLGSGIGGSAVETIENFFMGQGVASQTVKNAYRYHDLLPPQNYLLEFTRSGIPARLLGLEVYQGNSIERTVYGNSMAHAISRVVLGDNYLSGLGAGSSYIAEAFYDLGYWGIAAISVVYGALLAAAENLIPGRVIRNAVLLLIVQKIFWAPRGSATGFISTLGSFSTIGVILGVFFITELRMSALRARVGRETHLEGSGRATATRQPGVPSAGVKSKTRQPGRAQEERF